MNELEKLSLLLKNKKYIVYIDNQISWYDQVIKYCNNRNDLTIIYDVSMYKLCYLYDFSDRFIVIEENEMFGSIWNYVRTGMLSVDEALEQLLPR